MILFKSFLCVICQLRTHRLRSLCSISCCFGSRRLISGLQIEPWPSFAFLRTHCRIQISTQEKRLRGRYRRKWSRDPRLITTIIAEIRSCSSIKSTGCIAPSAIPLMLASDKAGLQVVHLTVRYILVASAQVVKLHQYCGYDSGQS